MLYYSDDVDKYLKTLIPKIIIGTEYKIVGSYGKLKYITDVDITNYVSKETNIMDRLKSVVKNLSSQVHFLTITVGTDPEFDIPWTVLDENTVTNYNQDVSTKFVKNLYAHGKITETDRDYCLELLIKKPTVNNLMLIEDRLYQKAKIKLTLSDLATFKSRIPVGSIAHFIVDYQDDFIPIDVAFVDKEAPTKYVKPTFDKGRYLMFLKKEYYFILALLARYFYNDQTNLQKISYLLNDRYGNYRQILMNLFYLIQFMKYPIYDSDQIQKKYDFVQKKVKETTDYENILTGIPSIESLTILESDLTKHLNKQFEPYAKHYYSLIYPKIKLKFADLAFEYKNGK